MKYLFFSAATMAVVLSCSRENDNNSLIENKGTLTFRSENLSFREITPLPEQMWQSTSFSDKENLYISTGKRLLIYNTINNSWQKIINEYDNELKSSNFIAMPDYYVIFNGLENETVSLYRKDGGSSSNLGGMNKDNVKSAGFTAGIGESAYMAGGSYANGVFSNKLSKVDFSYYPTITWKISLITKMPESKETQIEYINNKIYVIGGYDGSKASKRIDMYDISNNRWIFIGEMPYAFRSHSTCVQGNKIWIVGNYNLNDQQLAYYDTSTNEFVTINSNITPRRHANAEIIDNKLYVFSGATSHLSSSALTSMQVANLR